MPPFGRHLWVLVLALIVGSSLVLAACGSSESTATLNTEKIEAGDCAEQHGSARAACSGELPVGDSPDEGVEVLLQGGRRDGQHAIRRRRADGSGRPLRSALIGNARI